MTLNSVRRALVVLLAPLMLVVACGTGDGEAPVKEDGHGSHDHGSHDHGSLPGIVLDDLAEPPSVRIVVEPDGAGGATVEVVVDGIDLVVADQPFDHRPGEGHLHVSVDGTTVAMTADTKIHLVDLVDGHREVAVSLSSNDHRDYLLAGSLIGDSAMVVVTGGLAPIIPDHVFSVEVFEGQVVGGVPRFEVSVGDLVEIEVASDADDEVHLHTYDESVSVAGGGRAFLRVEATIPGVFEAELHGSGLKVFELQVS
ncbi:MAG: hypothetical protein VYC56_03385 [Actinomycetota bacterium]|nr:hypothetical protein [Actinomycetota bacterium]